MTRFAAAVLAAALAAAGCGNDEAPPESADAAAGDGTAIVRAYPPSTSGGYEEAAREVLRDAPSWAAAWKKANAHMAPIPTAPEVDFAKEMVAFAALGVKPSAGFGIEIVGARRAGGRLCILYALTEPPPGGMSATVMTHPWHAVVLPRSDDPVVWMRYTVPTQAPPSPPK